MKRKLGIVVMLLCIAIWASAQAFVSNIYTGSAIPEALTKGVDAVYRLDEGVLEVTSASKYSLRVHQVVTVLNEEGAGHLHLSLPFDKFYKVAEVEVNIYNNAGLLFRRYRKSDFTVQSYYDGISLATDDKIMQLEAAAPGYPFTIETKYVINTSGYIDLPNWYINNTTDAVEKFRYTVKVPAQQDIRYKTINLDIEPVISYEAGQKIYTWETQNVAVQKRGKGGFEAAAYLPQVKIAPLNFEYDGYKGSFTNWNDFGRWCYGLYDEKKPFSEPRAGEIKALVKEVPDVTSKVAVLYDYLQKNMRYVSIQFGIGGYKPFTALFVDEKKYGDCKALTNYMRSLLAVAGIRSYPALVNAGYDKLPVSPGFPENVFNHVILCVPNGRDSIWLECTSNSSDPGYLGSFTENKNVLLLTENGGFLVRTPASDHNKNFISGRTEVVIDEEGAAKSTTQLSSSGSYYEILGGIRELESEKQAETYARYFALKRPDQFELLPESNLDGAHVWKISTAYEKIYDFKAGGKFFMPLCLNTLCSEMPDVQSNRKIEYLFRFPYKKVDTTIYRLPTGFTVKALPKSVQLQAPPAYYSREVRFDATSNTIQVISTMTLKNNIIKPDEYKALSGLFDEVNHLETEKLVLEEK